MTYYTIFCFSPLVMRNGLAVMMSMLTHLNKPSLSSLESFMNTSWEARFFKTLPRSMRTKPSRTQKPVLASSVLPCQPDYVHIALRANLPCSFRSCGGFQIRMPPVGIKRMPSEIPHHCLILLYCGKASADT